MDSTVHITDRRALRPSDAVVWAVGYSKDNCEDLLSRLAVLAAAAVAAWWLMDWSYTAMALSAAVVAAGVWMTLAARRRKMLDYGITERIAVALTVCAGFFPLAFLLGGPLPRASSLIALGFWEFFARATSGKVREPAWWAHDRLARALVAAGILKMVRTGEHEQLPTLLYPGGNGKETKSGRWVQVSLPQATTLEKCLAHHDELASELGLPPERLHIERKRGAPAGHITFAVLKPVSDDPVPLEVPETWNAGDPIPVGTDRLDRPIEIKQRDCHSAWAAATRSGKTWGARVEVAFPLRDPSGVPLWIVTGKDVSEDWQPARELCVEMEHEGDYAYATIQDLPRVLRVLEHVEKVAMYRDTIPRSERTFGLLVLEEWYRIKVQAKAYDVGRPREEKIHDLLVQKVSSLAASLAAYNIHIVGCFQRATDTYIGADLRANMTQKFQGIAVKNSEISLFLDSVPQVCPSAKGEFLYTYDDSPLTLFRMPMLDNEAFAEICAQAKAWRLDHPMPALLPGGYEPSAQDRERFYPEIPEVEDDPLTLAVWEILRSHGKAQATTIYERLPSELAISVGNRENLGRLLKNEMDGVRQCYGGPENRTRMYELIPHPAGDPGTPRWLIARGELEPRLEQPSSLEELGFTVEEGEAA